ncbi:hypothetical protein PITCH_A2030041 [uncultured Desulfobacterium sp.]|uniref:Uncharacterized protein n=1 Tax=uncultured Desulfobacterium sp. TaxID=201089 RepID=A0A445MWM5_9BACT|nr:hypothetical protein PITCH_A2030041 [uncultured Desulfobacterium sp.]
MKSQIPLSPYLRHLPEQRFLAVQIVALGFVGNGT